MCASTDGVVFILCTIYLSMPHSAAELADAAFHNKEGPGKRGI